MKHGRDVEAREWLFQAPRTEKWIDFARVPIERAPTRRVMRDGDTVRTLQPRQRGFELECLVDGLVNKRLDHRFPPCAKCAAPEATTESANASEPYPVHLVGVAIEHPDAGVA